MTDIEPREDVEVGICRQCGQELLRTKTDCWHPWNVRQECPPTDHDMRSRTYGKPAFGEGTGRPGRSNFVPTERHTYVPPKRNRGRCVCSRQELSTRNYFRACPVHNPKAE